MWTTSQRMSKAARSARLAGRARNAWEALTKYRAGHATGRQSIRYHSLTGLQTLTECGGYAENSRNPLKSSSSKQGARSAFFKKASEGELGSLRAMVLGKAMCSSQGICNGAHRALQQHKRQEWAFAGRWSTFSTGTLWNKTLNYGSEYLANNLSASSGCIRSGSIRRGRAAGLDHLLSRLACSASPCPGPHPQPSFDVFNGVRADKGSSTSADRKRLHATSPNSWSSPQSATFVEPLVNRKATASAAKGIIALIVALGLFICFKAHGVIMIVS